MVRSDYTASHSAWFFPQREGTGAEDRRLRAALQPQTATFYLDSYSRFHSPEDRPPLLTCFRNATLERPQEIDDLLLLLSAQPIEMFDDLICLAAIGSCEL